MKTAPYFPIVLNYNTTAVEGNQNRKWLLKIQSAPIYAIHFSGDIPTKDEMAEALKPALLPDYMTDAFLVLCNVAQNNSA